MSRIRSIHPGLFTDEDYMGLGFPARELLKGLWIEADDHGVFVWTLRTLKARILPADDVDMEALMTELSEHRFVRSFTAGGKKYGAIRNFGKYQRPRKPTYLYPVPEEIGAYLAQGRSRAEPFPSPRAAVWKKTGRGKRKGKRKRERKEKRFPTESRKAIPTAPSRPTTPWPDAAACRWRRR